MTVRTFTKTDAGPYIPGFGIFTIAVAIQPPNGGGSFGASSAGGGGGGSSQYAASPTIAVTPGKSYTLPGTGLTGGVGGTTGSQAGGTPAGSGGGIVQFIGDSATVAGAVGHGATNKGVGGTAGNTGGSGVTLHNGAAGGNKGTTAGGGGAGQGDANGVGSVGTAGSTVTPGVGGNNGSGTKGGADGAIATVAAGAGTSGGGGGGGSGANGGAGSDGTLTITENALFSVITYDTNPASTQQNTGFTVVISARDSGGNVDTAYTGQLTLSLTSGNGTPGATLSGTKVLNAIAGTATFTGLSIDLKGYGYTITATPDTSNFGPAIVSSRFNIAPVTSYVIDPQDSSAPVAFVIDPGLLRQTYCEINSGINHPTAGSAYNVDPTISGNVGQFLSVAYSHQVVWTDAGKTPLLVGSDLLYNAGWVYGWGGFTITNRVNNSAGAFNFVHLTLVNNAPGFAFALAYIPTTLSVAQCFFGNSDLASAHVGFQFGLNSSNQLTFAYYNGTTFTTLTSTNTLASTAHTYLIHLSCSGAGAGLMTLTIQDLTAGTAAVSETLTPVTSTATGNAAFNLQLGSTPNTNVNPLIGTLRTLAIYPYVPNASDVYIFDTWKPTLDVNRILSRRTSIGSIAQATDLNCLDSLHDFSDPTVMFQDTAGTTPVTSNNDPIKLWKNKIDNVAGGISLLRDWTWDNTSTGDASTGNHSTALYKTDFGPVGCAQWFGVQSGAYQNYLRALTPITDLTLIFASQALTVDLVSHPLSQNGNVYCAVGYSTYPGNPAVGIFHLGTVGGINITRVTTTPNTIDGMHIYALVLDGHARTATLRMDGMIIATSNLGSSAFAFQLLAMGIDHSGVSMANGRNQGKFPVYGTVHSLVNIAAVERGIAQTIGIYYPNPDEQLHNTRLAAGFQDMVGMLP